ncbi:MAG: AraC family transcriptional regulator [Mobilicoccus sp.]|nr:AraC family transcriptional regulator [Mobilicoccus sp.]
MAYALAAHPIVVTRDPEQAADVLGVLFGSGTVTLRDGSFVAHARRFLDTTVAHLDLDGPGRLAATTDDAWFVHLFSKGQVKVRWAGEVAAHSSLRAFVTGPGQKWLMELADDCPQTVVRFERAAMEQGVRAALGFLPEEELVFDPVLDLTDDEAVRWHGALNLVFAELSSPGSLIHQGVGARALQDLLVSTLLLVQPSSLSARLRPTAPSPRRRTVTAAIEYVDAHLSDPIGPTDLAAHAGCSVRTLQQAFRDDIGVTPVTFIRDRRLDRVRADLEGAGPDVRISEVAARWGFGHLGGFAGHYRQRFGETPSDTVKGE